MVTVFFSKEKLTTLIPKRKLAERRQGHIEHVLKTMFPGYVLVKTDMDETVYYNIKSIPHLIGILKSDGEYFTKIPSEEITSIQCLLSDGDVVDYSQIYVDNSTVRVQSGPLKGKEALIKQVNKRKNRVKIEIQFLGCAKTLDVGIEMLSSNV